jgi:hypothetical protein
MRAKLMTLPTRLVRGLTIYVVRNIGLLTVGGARLHEFARLLYRVAAPVKRAGLKHRPPFRPTARQEPRLSWRL